MLRETLTFLEAPEEARTKANDTYIANELIRSPYHDQYFLRLGIETSVRYGSDSKDVIRICNCQGVTTFAQYSALSKFRLRRKLECR